jgi:hypothetical protein
MIANVVVAFVLGVGEDEGELVRTDGETEGSWSWTKRLRRVRGSGL